MARIFSTPTLLLITLLSVMPTYARTVKDTLSLPGRQGQLTTNRLAYIEYASPKENGLPILLLGPGVNRGVLSFDSLLSSLRKKGYGYVSLHFSTLPHSVAALGAEKAPYFEEEDFTMKDYAEEMEAAGLWAKEKFKREVIPVTLSFSGAPSSLLKGFKKIIDLAPMVSLKHARPTLHYYYRNLRLANMFNPFGNAVIRAAMDQSYLTVWRPKTDEMIKGFGFAPELEEKILAGYMASSRTLEGFEWDPSETPDTTLRAFVLAEEEGDSLLEGQVEALKNFYEINKNTACFFVRGAEHAISFSHPVTTAIIIDKIVKGESSRANGCYDVHDTNDFRFVPEDQFDSLFSLKN
ncbi:MAG: hypothetical protein K9K67_13285 [Bacteriovoracaceae bacterium]|nr:hypothetical protein [Bacteriovoracaceae bacterium]